MIEKVKRISAAFVVSAGMSPLLKAEPAFAVGCVEGKASYYGGKGDMEDGFHGKKTANGETFDRNELTAASTTYSNKKNIRVRVTNLNNGESTVVRINDYGPAKKTGRIIDLSFAAAKDIKMIKSGTAPVQVCPL